MKGGILSLNSRKIAELVGGTLIGDEEVLITGINSPDNARMGDVAFFFDVRYRELIKKTGASVLVLSEKIDDYSGCQIIVPDPKLAYARVAALFAPPVTGHSGVSSRAVLDEDVVIGDNVTVYPMVYIGKDAVIGDDVILFPGVFIGEGVKIGKGSVLYPNVTVMRDCVIGSGVIIHAGCVIGSDGFGYIRDGAENVKIPQLGIVQIDDNVEIGANTTIDRAAMGKTWIKRGVKADNLVQIAHNVVVGEDTVIVALSGISGSVQIGREVVIGGQVGIKDHVKIGDRAMVGSAAGVHKSLSPGEMVLGNPTMPPRLWIKTRGLIARLPELFDRIRNIEKSLKKLNEDK